MRNLLALLSGVVFGAGMALSGMTNPARVLGFFDVLGQWDPTLAFVMGGALMPMAIAWRIRAARARSLIGEPLPGPASRAIDARLLGGAALFGVGWGIVGLCPGAVVPALVYGGWPVWLFAAAMLAGMALHDLLERRLGARRAPA
jgi:uncharacterized membrane protein YedE/YeeE